MPTPENLRRLTAWHAAALYLAAAIAWTWPLLPNISTSVAWDLGDPLLVSWVMGWVNDSFLALFRGDTARFLALWDAPIFYPTPLTLAYSEHFIPQALMVLPVHAATGNVVLGYNIALLATFVLSGTGMFLLTRELTGSAVAGLLAGAIFGFTPYRVDQLSHLQILSSQWMPFVLYGLRRYFTTRSRRALTWAMLALVAGNLSSGYYLFFFAPFLVIYVLAEMGGRGLLRDLRTWRDVVAGAAAAAALTVPFLIPYLAARLDTGAARSYTEIMEFAGDVYGYATSSGYVAWWSTILDAMRATGENALFPGAMAALFAALTAAMIMIGALQRWKAAPERDGRMGPIVLFLAVASLLCFGAAVWVLLTGGRIVVIAGQEVRLRNLARFTTFGSIALIGAIAASRRLRAAFHGPRGSIAALALACAFASFMLSLGPRMETMNEFIGHGPYALLYKYMPGFNGLRVPSRFAMLVVMWLAIAAAYAAAAIARARRWGAAVVIACAVVAVAESHPRRFDLDSPFQDPDSAPLTMRHRMKGAQPLYDELKKMPRGVLLELPWGTTGWDIQFMHAQRHHQWPLVNGFSGFFPPTYGRTSVVSDVFNSPDRAWWALERSGASHVIVHEWAFLTFDRGKRVSQWLRDSGAVEVARTENDVLFRVPGGIRYR